MGKIQRTQPSVLVSSHLTESRVVVWPGVLPGWIYAWRPWRLMRFYFVAPRTWSGLQADVLDEHGQYLDIPVTLMPASADRFEVARMQHPVPDMSGPPDMLPDSPLDIERHLITKREINRG